jgi:regulator of ribonuclease activity A
MNLAEENGWVGIVIHGYVRDIHQTDKNSVALFALGTYPKKSKKIADGKFSCNLNFAGVTIKQDDYLYADLDGIIITKQKVDI